MYTTPLFIQNIGPWGAVLIAVVVLVLFGRGKVAGLMGEVGKGINSFRSGLKQPENEIEDASDEVEDATAAARDVTPEERSERDNA